MNMSTGREGEDEKRCDEERPPVVVRVQPCTTTTTTNLFKQLSKQTFKTLRVVSFSLGSRKIVGH